MGTVETLTIATAAFAAVRIINSRCKTSPAPAFRPIVGDKSITQLLDSIRQKYNMLAIPAAVVTSAGIKSIGRRCFKCSTEIPIGLNIHWHLGSDRKAMTSTLIARLVQQEKSCCSNF